jgi:ribonuclease-3
MEILDKLNIPYHNTDLYLTAFTHTSYANEYNTISYERLEFLGDAVLELIISEYLYKTCDEPEGKMTKLRSSYVCENALYEYSCLLGLNEEIRLGKGEEERDGKHNKTIVADIFESFTGAIFLDCGFDVVKKFIYDNVIPLIENHSIDFIEDYKSVLQELVQTDRKSLEYEVVSETGPAHDKTFEIVVKIDDIIYGSGVAHSKKEAEQLAAKSALKKAQNGS